VQQAQGAQGLDEVELARIEGGEVLIPVEQATELARIQRSWIAGAMRASSKSTKWGPPLALPLAGVHSTLDAWQSP